MEIKSIKVKIISALILSAALSPAAFAADNSAEITVKGKLMPGACKLDVNGGEISYGNISLQELVEKNERIIELGKRDIEYVINCPQKTTVSMSFVDNRKGSVPAEIGTSYFGLGEGALNMEDVKVGFGGYKISLTEPKVDGESALLGGINDVEGQASVDLDKFEDQNITYFNVDKSRYEGALFSGRYNVDTKIINPKEFKQGSIIEFDGSVTMNVSYL